MDIQIDVIVQEEKNRSLKKILFRDSKIKLLQRSLSERETQLKCLQDQLIKNQQANFGVHSSNIIAEDMRRASKILATMDNKLISLVAIQEL